MSRYKALCSAIALPAGEVPSWVHLLPAGDIRTIDGRGPYRIGNVSAMIAASLAFKKLPLDENHAIDLAAPKGEASPARGWIVDLQQRPDGIWGRVEWTAAGRQLMADRAYRGISPAIQHMQDGTITAVLRASLTNTPNFAGLVTLHSEQGAGSGAAGVELTAADREIIRLTGIDAEHYRANLPGSIALQSAARDAQHQLSAADHLMIQMLGVDPLAFAAERNR
jgi:hypothetical protein